VATNMPKVKIETATPGLLQGQSDVPHHRWHLHSDDNNEHNKVDNPCVDGNTDDVSEYWNFQSHCNGQWVKLL